MGGLSLDMEYLKSVPGIVKIIEVLLEIFVIACTAIDKRFIENGGGYVLFVAVVGAVTTIVLFFLNFFCIFSKLPTWRLLLEFLWSVAVMVAFFVSGVIAAVFAPDHKPAVGAAAFFCFMAFLAYAVDAFFAFWVWRAGVVQESTQSANTTVQAPTSTPNVQAGDAGQAY